MSRDRGKQTNDRKLAENRDRKEWNLCANNNKRERKRRKKEGRHKRRKDERETKTERKEERKDVSVFICLRLIAALRDKKDV